MHIYIHTYIYIYTFEYLYIYICTYMFLYIYLHPHAQGTCMTRARASNVCVHIISRYVLLSTSKHPYINTCVNMCVNTHG